MTCKRGSRIEVDETRSSPGSDEKRASIDARRCCESESESEFGFEFGMVVRDQPQDLQSSKDDRARLTRSDSPGNRSQTQRFQ